MIILLSISFAIKFFSISSRPFHDFWHDVAGQDVSRPCHPIPAGVHNVLILDLQGKSHPWADRNGQERLQADGQEQVEAKHEPVGMWRDVGGQLEASDGHHNIVRHAKQDVAWMRAKKIPYEIYDGEKNIS